MGLDGVELNMELEETFNIEIPDEDSQKVHTVQQLCEIVTARLNPENAKVSPCINMSAFHKLRNAFMNVLHVPRKSIRLDLELDHLLPIEQRTRSWEALQRNMGLRLPALGRSWRTVICTAMLVCMFSALGFAAFRSPWGFTLVFPAAFLAEFATRGLRTSFPGDCKTVRQATTVLWTSNHSEFVKANRAPAPDDVLLAVKRAISRQTRVPVEKIRPEDDLHKDLGLST